MLIKARRKGRNKDYADHRERGRACKAGVGEGVGVGVGVRVVVGSRRVKVSAVSAWKERRPPREAWVREMTSFWGGRCTLTRRLGGAGGLEGGKGKHGVTGQNTGKYYIQYHLSKVR